LWVEAAKESCSVPPVPAISIVAGLESMPEPAKSISPSCAEPTTWTITLTVPFSGILDALIWRVAMAVASTLLVV
jgi:hypothetical protein